MIEWIALAQLSAGLLNMPCERLSALSLERARVTSASFVAAGHDAIASAGVPRASSPEAPPLPAYCRVTMLLTPTPDSRINVELWLPTEHWNGKFLAVGNGGWAGRIQGYADMEEALRRGYATAGTDTGHSAEDGPNGMFALGHPEKIVDFAFRAVHDMAVQSKRIIAAFYERQLNYSYFKGCSTGGRQAVMAAQRYPGDFDGIIAGALANRHINMHTAAIARRIRIERHPDEAISAAKAELVTQAVMKKCDTSEDGFLNDPRLCSFDFSSLQCHGADAEGCLTAPELRSVETFYGGVRNSRGELIFSGQVLGNPMPELKPADPAKNGAFDTVRILGFQNAGYDWHSFDLDRDMPVIAHAVGFVDAVNPDLRAYKAAGGKLLLYAGWRDTGITPANTILYYESALREMGGDQDDWMRLFMVPGMGHCRGGPGPNMFDSVSALEDWRERNEAPDRIPGSNPQSGLTRPLCPYPQYAKYDGAGDRNDAKSWACAPSP